LLEELAGLREWLSGGIEGMADYVISQAAATDPLIAGLARLRDQLRGLTFVQLPRDFVVEMEGLYGRLRALAPSWLPLPAISFMGVPVQSAAPVVAIPVGVIILFVLFIIVMLWLLLRSNSRIRREQDEAVRRMIEEIQEGLRRKPEPEPEPRPPPPIPPMCPYPTGLTQLDPIPIQWFKLPSLYPSPIVLDDVEYRRDDPTTLPRGESIGVPSRFWPLPGKIVQLAPDTRDPSVTRDFRAVLASYGFDWGARRYLQADHVQDIQWGRPDGENLDTPINLWPYDGAANASAGPLQNNNQPVSFCETLVGPANINVPVSSLKRPGGWGRFFVIR